jgi:Fe-Mn family superoxide dismutase
MSAETLELHHDKHHMAYITNGNKFIKEQNIAEDNVNDIVINSYQKMLQYSTMWHNI